MANKEFKIQSNTVSLNGVNLSASADNKVVVPGVTRATGFRVDEVEKEDDYDASGLAANTIMVLDNAQFQHYNGTQASGSYQAPQYIVQLDDGEIDEIEVDVEGVLSADEKASAENNDMWITDVPNATDNFDPADWTQIPFRPKCKALSIESEFGGGGGADLGDFTIDGNVLEAEEMTIRTNDADIIIQSDSDVVVRSSAGNHEWQFNTSGNLELPEGGDIVDHLGQSVLGGGGGGGVDGLTGDTSFTPDSSGDTAYELDINNQIKLRTTYSGSMGPGIGLGNAAGNSAATGVIAIGNSDVGLNGKQGGVYIGYQAGWNDSEQPQGEYAIAIGAKASRNIARDNTIVLNATGAALDPTATNGLYIKPIRESSNAKALYYNTTTGEVTYNTISGGGGSGDTGDFTFDGTTFSHPENEHYIDFDSEVAGNLLIAAGPGKEININSGNAVNVVVGDTDHWAMIARSQQNNSGDGVEAAAVIYDSSNNVIMIHSKDVDGDDHIVISKFTSAGSLVWQKQISDQMDPDQSHDLAVDEDDNIYAAISNETGQFDDILIFKIDGSDGGEIWKKQYTPSVPVSVVEGDFVLVTTSLGGGTYNGSPVQTVEIEQDWSNLAGYTFRSSATGSAPFTNYGTIVYASYDSQLNKTTLFFASGTFNTNPIDGALYYSATGLAPNSWQELGSMVVSGADIFVSGRYQENTSGQDITQGFLFKASATDGSLDWYQKFDFADNTEGYGMEIGADGDPVVVGVSTADRPNAAWVTKFNGLTGAVLWSNYIFNSDTGDNYVSYTGADVTVDSQNNIYAAINASQNIVHDDNNNLNTTIAYVVKLNSTGTIQWTRRIGPGPCGSVATGIDHDLEGNVYLAALTTAQKNPVRDVVQTGEWLGINQNVLVIAKFNTSGAVLWQRYVKSSHYDFLASRDEGTGEAYWSAGNNRGRALSVSTDGKLAVQVTVRKLDPDDYVWNDRYYESITFQIAQDGRTLTLGSGDELFNIEESRIPGKFVTVPGSLTTEDPVNLNENIAEDVVVATPEFTLVEGILAQQLSTSASYEYTFGNDGTLTIPNDGDIRLTQTQIGWFSIFGPTYNNTNNIDIRASCVDPDTGDVYVVGESDDSSQGFLARYNSQGQIIWTIRFEDLDDNDNNRANAVKIHPTNGNIVVLLEFYSGYTSTVLVQVDPDTARVVSSASFRDLDTNDGCIAYDFDFMSNGNLVTAGRKYDEWKTHAASPQAGSTTSVLLVNSVPTGFNASDWRLSGTGITGRESVTLNSYTGISGTTRQGSGATFNVIANDGDPGIYTIVVADGGSNYLVGHKIKILGTSLGGTTPANDLIVTVSGATSGVIISVTTEGTADGGALTTYMGVSGTNYNVGSGFTFDFNLALGSNNYADIVIFGSATGGSNYVAGDQITIPGTTLYGTSPTNDMVLTVTAVGGGGGLSTWTYSGTKPSKEVIRSQTAVAFGGSGTWYFNQPLGGEAFVLVSDAATFNTVWSTVLSAGESGDTERYLSVAVGADNTVYAAGEMIARNNCAGADLEDLWCAVVSKFNSSGTHQWTKALNNTAGDCYAKGVAVRGNTIVVTYNNTNTSSTVVTKLDSTGSVKWQRSTNSNDDSSVAIDTNGDIYAVVEANFENSFNDCIKIIKFNTVGEITWRKFFGTTGFNDRFKNGRNLTIDSDHIYVSGYTYAYAGNYRNGFLVKLPKTGDCDGRYGTWATQLETYDVTEVTSTEATAFTPNVGTGEFETVSVDFETNWWDPSDNNYYHTLEEIRDRDGGAIEFADGTRQTSSAQQIPQRKLNNGEDHRLVLEDMGKHIFIANNDTDIKIPYNADIPLPIGFTVVIINDTGGTLNIDADGGGITIRKGSDTNSYWDLESYGMATLIKVDTDYWYISGNVAVD